MIEQLSPPLLPLEKDILLWINSHHSPFLDAFMFMISNPGAWAILVAVLLYFLFYKKPWQEGVLVLIAIALCIVVCDQLSSNFAKPFFARPRPTHTEGIKEQLHIVYQYVGKQYGFFSGHASNFFAVATILALTIRKYSHSFIIFGLVALVTYSRMYLGVHYLSDILVGMLLGIATGYITNALRESLRRAISPQGYKTSPNVFEAGYTIWLYALLFFLPILIAYSWQVANIISRL